MLIQDELREETPRRHDLKESTEDIAMRLIFLMSLLVSCIPPTALAQDEIGHWYLNPYIGGITPDTPWGGKGSTALYGLGLSFSFGSRKPEPAPAVIPPA